MTTKKSENALVAFVVERGTSAPAIPTGRVFMGIGVIFWAFANLMLALVLVIPNAFDRLGKRVEEELKEK